MNIHNHGKFHLYSICGCQVINFQMFSWRCSIDEIVLFGEGGRGRGLGPNSSKCCQILEKFLPKLVFKEMHEFRTVGNCTPSPPEAEKLAGSREKIKQILSEKRFLWPKQNIDIIYII